MNCAKLLAGTVVSVLCGSAMSASAAELNVLGWCDHTDPALLKPFEEVHNVTVNVKEFEGTGAALSILGQSQPGDWDVVVIDTVDVRRLVERKLLGELPQFDALTADQFPEVVMRDKNTVDGKTYAVTEKFGYNAVAFDKTKVSMEDVNDLSILLSQKYEGKLAVYDYYLPMIGLMGLDAGLAPSEITEDKLPVIRDKLVSLKRNAKVIGETVAAQTALATGEVDIVLGVGETMTGTLQTEKPNLDWEVPKQGAMRWSQSIGIANGTTKPDMALEFVKYIASPEGQKRLATSSCYWGMPANKKAGDLMSADEKRPLHWDKQADYLARTQLYPAPDEALDAKFQDVWTSVLQN